MLLCPIMVLHVGTDEASLQNGPDGQTKSTKAPWCRHGLGRVYGGWLWLRECPVASPCY